MSNIAPCGLGRGTSPPGSHLLLKAVALLLVLSWCAASVADARPKRRKKVKSASETQATPDRVLAKDGAVKLHAGPGDGFEVVATFEADTEVIVRETQGRWVRVEAGKRKGWLVNRSLASFVASEPVLSPDDTNTNTNTGNDTNEAGTTEVAEATAPAKRNWGGDTEGASSSFVATIANADTQLRSSMKEGSESLGSLIVGAKVIVEEHSGDRRWLRVRSGDGQVGWIAASEVVNTTSENISSASGAGQASVDSGELASWSLGDLPRAQVRTSLGLAYRSLSMDFSSTGRGRLANTIVETQAMALDGGTDIILRSKGRGLFLGFDGGFRFSYSKPGIEVISADGPIGDIDFSMYETRAGARVGVALGRDVHVAVRAGLHYDVFFTKSVDNAGLLPRESLLAGTAGARIDWYRFLPDVVLTLSGEGQVLGRRKQTPGLEDGRQGDLQGVWVSAGGSYRIGKRLDLSGSFLYGWNRSEWSGASARNPDVMQSSRSDTSQTLQVALAHRF